MHTIAGYCKRYPALSHEDYRSAHGGFHMSLGRRLRGMRGYVFNCWTDRGFAGAVPGATVNEPAGFFDLWDGFVENWYVDAAACIGTRQPQPDRSGPDGLWADDYVAQLGGDTDYLYAGPPHMFVTDEHVIVPTVRPEHRLTKLQQWGRRASDIPIAEFRERWLHEYAPLHRRIANLHGHSVLFRGEEAMTGILRPQVLESAMSPSGTALREEFFSHWDGYGVLFLAALEDLRAFRDEHGSELRALEAELFDAVWYREIDEIVAVLPKRDDPLPIYQR